MRPLYFLALLVVLTCASCEKKTTPFAEYTITLDRDNLNLDGSGLVRELEQDTVMARTDTEAYRRALIYVAAHQHTANRLNNGNIHAFVLSDSTGANVADRLDPTLIDSMTTEIVQLTQNL